MTDEDKKIRLSTTIHDKEFCLECLPESTLGEVYDAVMSLKNYLIERMQQAEQKQPNEENACPTKIN